MKNILFLKKENTIKFALKSLNGAFGKIGCVVDKKKKLLGVVTEGDLRRAILNGNSIRNKLANMINKNPTFIYKDELISKKLVKSKFISKKLNDSIFYIPIVDKNNKIVNVLSTENAVNILENKLEKKNKSKLPHILIIGGAGYIGTVLTSLMLKKNYKVTILDKLLYDKKIFKNNFKKNKNLKFILGDVCDLNVQINSIKDIDAVVFLAEIVGDPACNARPEDALKTNYLSLSSMATLCSLLSISKFIYTSSCSVYGINKNNDLLHESSSLNPISHYARIKIMSEKALLSNKTDTFQPTILRLGTVFGPSLRNRFDLVVNTLAKNAFFNKKITVNGGNQWRPNIHVEDVANGIIAAINAPLSKVGSKIFNLSNEKLNYKIIEIAKFAKEAFPSAKLEVKGSNTDPRNYRVSSKKFTIATKFKAKNNIRNTYNEFKKIFLNRKIKNPNNKIFSNIESLS